MLFHLGLGAALVVADEPHVGLVHERGRLQRHAKSFTRQLARREPAQLGIHERQELVRGLRLARLDRAQDPRGVGEHASQD